MHIPMQFVHVLNSACGKVMEVRAKGGGYSGHSVGKIFCSNASKKTHPRAEKF